MRTYDDFIDLEVKWRRIFDYAWKHRDDEPFNQRLFKDVMSDTLDWFEARIDKSVCRQYDLEVYNYVLQYAVLALKQTDSGMPDNGKQFSASQIIAGGFTRYIIDPVKRDNVFYDWYIRHDNEDLELVYFVSWSYGAECEYVYNFSTGDIQEFIEYNDIDNGDKPKPTKSNITNVDRKRPVAKKPAPAVKKAVARKPAVKKAAPKKQTQKTEPIVKKTAVKKPSVKKAAPKSKTASSTKKKKDN